jgi:hypothetical protein
MPDFVYDLVYSSSGFLCALCVLRDEIRKAQHRVHREKRSVAEMPRFPYSIS